MAVIFNQIQRFSFKLYKNEYNGVFEVADYSFGIKNEKFKIADSINGHFLLNLRSRNLKYFINKFCHEMRHDL